jgi:hypothetical protein
MAKKKLTKAEKAWLATLKRHPALLRRSKHIEKFLKVAREECPVCKGRRVHIKVWCGSAKGWLRIVGPDGKDGLSLWPEED